MRVHYAKLLIVAAIAYAAESKTTTSVAGNSITQLNSTTNDIDDERSFFSPMVEKVPAYFTSQKLKNIAKKLEAFHDGYELHSMPNLYKWLDAAKIGAPGSHPRDSAAVIKVLTDRFGDNRVARFIQAAKEDSITMKYAVDLEEAHMKYWLDQQKSARDVFKLLNSHEAEYGFLTDPAFMYYSSYVKRLNTVYPRMKRASINTIPEYFPVPDRLEKRVNLALEIAQGSSARAKKVSKAERDTTKSNLVQYWLDRETSLEDVFKCWKDYNAKSSIAVTKSRLVASLASCIGEDGMFTLVEAELKVHKSSVLADQVQAEGFMYWIMNGKSLVDVIELLKLDHAGIKELENPLLNTFTKFSEVYSKRARKSKRVMQGFITPEYAAGTPMSVTTDSEKALFQLWFASEKTPDDVFNLLNLDTAGDELFASSAFPMYLKYLDGQNLIPRRTKFTSFDAITKSYDPAAIATMILAAEKGSKSWYGAERLQREVFARWTDIHDPYAGHQSLGIRESDEAMMRLYKVFLDGLPKKKVYTWPEMFKMVEYNFNALKPSVEECEIDEAGELIGKTAEAAQSYKDQLIELLPYLEKDVVHAEQVKVINDYLANMKPIKKPIKKPDEES